MKGCLNVSRTTTSVIILVLASGLAFAPSPWLRPAAASDVCVQPPAGLVGWWPGNGNANDIANGNNATLQDGATFAPGMVGQAFTFDGMRDSVNEAAPVHFALQDVDEDGALDMILQFNTEDTGIVCGTTVGTLTGRTIGGRAVKGSDSVNTPSCS